MWSAWKVSVPKSSLWEVSCLYCTWIRDIVPVRRIKLIFCFQDLFKQFGIILVIEGRITTQPETQRQHRLTLPFTDTLRLFYDAKALITPLFSSSAYFDLADFNAGCPSWCNHQGISVYSWDPTMNPLLVSWMLKLILLLLNPKHAAFWLILIKTWLLKYCISADVIHLV